MLIKLSKSRLHETPGTRKIERKIRQFEQNFEGKTKDVCGLDRQAGEAFLLVLFSITLTSL